MKQIKDTEDVAIDIFMFTIILVIIGYVMVHGLIWG